MKTRFLGFIVVLAAASALAQGSVNFNNRAFGTVVTHVYAWNPADPLRYQSGNGPTDTPAGTTDWSEYLPLSGNGYTAQLWAAPGANQAESSLLPAFPTTTFRTGVAAGFVVPTTATLTGVPADAPSATVQIRVWDNQGGTIDSWIAANIRTESPLFNLNAIGGTFNTPPNLVGLQSFGFSLIPEPSALVLGCLGAALLALVRRKSK